MPSLRARLVNRYLRLVMKPKRLDLIDPPALRDWIERRAMPSPPKRASLIVSLDKLSSTPYSH